MPVQDPIPTISEKSPQVEEMEIVTSQLSSKLHIEDIDAADTDNPQLCAEYVKDIYEYMMMLEVSFSEIQEIMTMHDLWLVFSRENFTSHPPT